LTYNLGQMVGLSTTVTDASGNPTDATVTVAVTKPDGTAASPSAPTHDGTGLYSSTIVVDQAGTWFVRWDATGAIIDNERSQFDVGDPKRPAYATLAQFKGRIQRTDTVRDSDLSDALDAASRQVDKDTGRQFWLHQTASARIYNPQSRVVRTHDGEKILVDDIGSTTGLVVEIGSVATSWTAVTDYETGPDNAIAMGDAITTLLRPWQPWTVWRNGRVRVTAHWGWPQVPDQITQATLLRAHRIYSRRGSPEGVAGFGDMGVVRVGRYDPDYDSLIAPYVLPGFG
jgi:hypothetical protein